ncbi:MAG: hypothetical protein QM784_22980 [Polyangiaceae bacterium]
MAFSSPYLTRFTALTLLASTFLCGCGSESSKKSGELQVTVSAEGLGAHGYAFPPTSGQEIAFVDGWSVDFDRIIVAIDNIRLSKVPDKDPGDQSVLGTEVAIRKGPFIVDLKEPGNVLDKGGAGKVAIRLPIDDLEDLFDLEQRYAFSYDLVAATADATRVNVEADDPDVLAMIDGGNRALLKGSAKFKEQSCKSSIPTYDFEKLPKEVAFEFGLDGEISYVNCQNPDNTGAAIEGEEAQRGIQMLPSGVTTAQITIHTDHLFWPAISHENLPLFDPFAANAKLVDGTYSVDLEMLEAVPLPGVTDGDGQPLPWRSCVDSSMYILPTQPTQLTFDTGSQALDNLHDFVQFNAATMGHLNADGLCYVKGFEHAD